MNEIQPSVVELGGDRVPSDEAGVQRFVHAIERRLEWEIRELQELLEDVRSETRRPKRPSPRMLQAWANQLASVDCRDEALELLGHSDEPPEWWPPELAWEGVDWE